MCDGSERCQVRDHDRRVRDRLHVQHRGAGSRQRGVHGGEVACIDELSGDPEPREDTHEQIAGRAVDRLRGHDRLARPDHRDDRGVDRGHTRREGQASLRALEFRHGIAECGGSRVVDPAVRVARRRAGQHVAQLRGVGRGKGRGLIDRDARRNLVDVGSGCCRLDSACRKASHAGMLHRGPFRPPAQTESSSPRSRSPRSRSSSSRSPRSSRKPGAGTGIGYCGAGNGAVRSSGWA